MAVISSQKYLDIATELGTARTSMLSAITNMFNAVYDVAILDDIQSTLDLLQPMYAAYQLADNNLRSINNFTSAVTALNNHVVRRGNYTTLNDYLYAIGATNSVDSEFVSMSNTLGYDIDEVYSDA
jgi:hypothetical protein